MASDIAHTHVTYSGGAGGSAVNPPHIAWNAYTTPEMNAAKVSQLLALLGTCFSCGDTCEMLFCAPCSHALKRLGLDRLAKELEDMG